MNKVNGNSEQFKVSENCITEIIFLLSHAICTIALCINVCFHRIYYPIKQNSPILIVYSQICLFIASLSLCIAKIISFQHNIDNMDKIICKDQLFVTVCNYIYTFSMQFILFSYLLRLLRISLVYSPGFFAQKNKIKSIPQKIFGNQNILALLAIIWGLLIVFLDLWTKYIYWDETQYSKDFYQKLYPQIDQFLCDQSLIIDQHDQNYNKITTFYFIKIGLYLVIYAVLYMISDRVNAALCFRRQYNALLFLKLSVMISRNIININKQDWCITSVMIVYYLECLTNLMTSIIFLKLYFMDKQTCKKFYLITLDDLDFGLDIKNCLQFSEASISLKKFFEQNQQLDLLIFYEQTIIYEQKLPFSKENQKLFLFELMCFTKNIIEKYLVTKSTDRFNKVWIDKLKQIWIDNLNQSTCQDNFYVYKKLRKNIIQKYLDSRLQEWKKTYAYRQIQRICQQNCIYQNRLKQLQFNSQIYG